MPSENDLPGTSLPLSPDIQEAIDEFKQPLNLSKAMRTAVIAVLFEDLKEEVRKLLKDRGL